MEHIGKRWGMTVLAAKWVGLVGLAVHSCLAPFRCELAWSAAYVGLSLVVIPLLMPGVVPLVRWLSSLGKVQSESALQERAIAAGESVRMTVLKRPLEMVLAAGEDGLFFLPLLYLGIEPIPVLIASLGYAAIHYPVFPLWACAIKWVFYFIVGMFILPHGIITVVLGHLANNGIALVLTPHLRRWQDALRKPDPA